MPSIYIDFQVTSEFSNINLDFLFNVIGKFHKIGDISKTGMKLDYSQWNYSFPELSTYDVNDVADLFFFENKNKIDLINKYCTENRASICIYFVIKNFDNKNEQIYLGLSKENIKNFSLINAEVRFDGL